MQHKTGQYATLYSVADSMEGAMRKLQVRDASVMVEAIREEISRSEESRYDHRLHGVLMVTLGMSCYEVGRWLGEHSTSVQRWVRRFERRGFAGLQEGDRPGRPSRIAPGIVKKLERELRREPRSLGYEQTLWDGEAAFASSEDAPRSGAQGAPMPAAVRPTGISAQKAASPDRAGRPGAPARL